MRIDTSAGKKHQVTREENLDSDSEEVQTLIDEGGIIVAIEIGRKL